MDYSMSLRVPLFSTQEIENGSKARPVTGFEIKRVLMKEIRA